MDAFDVKFLIIALNLIASSSGTFHTLINSLLTLEFESSKSYETVLRRNTLATKILDSFIKRSGQRFLRIVLSEPVRVVAFDRKIEMVELKGAENLKTKERKKTIQKLSRYIELFTDFIFSPDSLKLLPFEIKVISKEIFDLSQKFKCDPLPRVGSLFILRMLNPAICVPDKNGLVSSSLLEAKHRRAYMLIAKSIQCLSNRKTASEGYMKHISPCLEKLQKKADKFLMDICIDRKEIESKKGFLKKSKINADNYNEICLLLYNFLLNQGIKINLENVKVPNSPRPRDRKREFTPKVTTFTDKFGKIVYAVIFKIQKSGKIQYKVDYCLDGFYDEEEKYVKEVEEIFDKDAADVREFNSSRMITISGKDRKVCEELQLLINFSYQKNYFFFCVTKYNSSKFIVYNFLEELKKKYFEMKLKNYANTFKLMEEIIMKYNKGKDIDKEQLMNLLNDLAKELDQNYNEGKLWAPPSVGQKRNLFRHVKPFEKLLQEFNNY